MLHEHASARGGPRAVLGVAELVCRVLDREPAPLDRVVGPEGQPPRVACVDGHEAEPLGLLQRLLQLLLIPVVEIGVHALHAVDGQRAGTVVERAIDAVHRHVVLVARLGPRDTQRLDAGPREAVGADVGPLVGAGSEVAIVGRGRRCQGRGQEHGEDQRGDGSSGHQASHPTSRARDRLVAASCSGTANARRRPCRMHPSQA